MVSSNALIITLITAICGSSGIWGIILYLIQHKHKIKAESLEAQNEILKREKEESKLLRGIGHAQLIKQCKYYISLGYITPEQHKELNDYLYAPYKNLGGNGTASRLVEEVNKLPIEPTERFTDSIRKD